MKSIRVDIIFKQAVYFALLEILVINMLGFPSIHGITLPKETIEKLLEVVYEKGISILLVTGLLTIMGEEGSGIALVLVLEKALLWGIFYERWDQYNSLEMIPKIWLITLLIVSSILAIPFLITWVSFLMKIHWKLEFIWILPAIVSMSAMKWMPLWVAGQTGWALYKASFKPRV